MLMPQKHVLQQRLTVIASIGVFSFCFQQVFSFYRKRVHPHDFLLLYHWIPSQSFIEVSIVAKQRYLSFLGNAIHKVNKYRDKESSSRQCSPDREKIVAEVVNTMFKVTCLN